MLPGPQALACADARAVFKADPVFVCHISWNASVLLRRKSARAKARASARNCGKRSTPRLGGRAGPQRCSYTRQATSRCSYNSL